MSLPSAPSTGGLCLKLPFVLFLSTCGRHLHTSSFKNEAEVSPKMTGSVCYGPCLTRLGVRWSRGCVCVGVWGGRALSIPSAGEAAAAVGIRWIVPALRPTDFLLQRFVGVDEFGN